MARSAPETEFHGRLRHALDDANIPALVMACFQMSGDERFLEAPFAPSRKLGMDANDSGGLPPEIQQEVREVALREALRVRAGGAVAHPAPREDLLVRMMSTCVGEPVGPEFEPMFSLQLGFRPADRLSPTVARDPAARSAFRVAIIGAGFGGISVAKNLQDIGVSFEIFERHSDPGGVWARNHYPGVGVDTPSYLYELSYRRHDWSSYFARGKDVADYARTVVDELRLDPFIRYGTEVVAAEYLDSREWMVETRDTEGTVERHRFNAVVSAVGLFSSPNEPRIPGLRDRFQGRVFHSADWPADEEIDGKRIALVGTGASAMQILPVIADRAEQVDVYQRSPQWIVPASDYFRTVPESVRLLRHVVPFYDVWYRFMLAWTFNDKVHPTLQVDPDWPHPDRAVNEANDKHREFCVRYINRKLGDRPDLVEHCIPQYPPWGRRMLIDNGWYEALIRPDVELLTGTIDKIDETGIWVDGRHRPVDTIIACTGFQAQRFLHPMKVVGRAGTVLHEMWDDDDARAYLGITVPRFPNLFIVYGPNTNGSGGSILTQTETQASYIAQVIEWITDNRAAAVEPKESVFTQYNEDMDRRLDLTVWSHPRVSSYYRNARGRVVLQMPWRVVDYWQMIRTPSMADFDVHF